MFTYGYVVFVVVVLVIILVKVGRFQRKTIVAYVSR